MRCAPISYADGISLPAERGLTNPNPRKISNFVSKTNKKTPSKQQLSDMCWLWGQFLDHEIALTLDSDESFDIEVCVDDSSLPAGGSIPMHRSNFSSSTGTGSSNPRLQTNEISSYIDANNVYGSDKQRNQALRTFANGLLKTSYGCDGALPPYNYYGLPNASLRHNEQHEMYLCGDIRANENALLTAMHTLWVREHNRLARELRQMHHNWTDEQLFQEARRIVIALMQHITFDEFLPALLGGSERIPTYNNYDPNVDPSMCSEFSACLFRLGHSMVSSKLRYEKPLTKSAGHGAVDIHEVPLDSVFFKPSYVKQNGIQGLLLGASRQVQEEIDVFIAEELRSRLFAPHPSGTMLDLAAINIQRGRDHGLPDYNTMRLAYGLDAKPTIESITSDPTIRTALRQAYGIAATPDDIDPWIGALAEDHVDENTSVGELLLVALREQFVRLRDGDRFWYERDSHLSEWRKEEIKRTRLSHVIARNTDLRIGEGRGWLSCDVFHVKNQ